MEKTYSKRPVSFLEIIAIGVLFLILFALLENPVGIVTGFLDAMI